MISTLNPRATFPGYSRNVKRRGLQVAIERQAQQKQKQIGTKMNTETEKEMPDYKMAAQELAELFAKLPIKAEIANGRAGLDKAESKEGRDWAHYACEVVFRDANTSKELARVPWCMGIGNVDWKNAARRNPRDMCVQAMADGRRITPDSEMRAVASVTHLFSKNVKPIEVLASYARDAQDASGQSFDEWCGNLGFDTDSRKALETYLACQAGEAKVRAVIGKHCTLSQLAELSNRL